MIRGEVAWLLQSVLLGRLPVFSVVLTCPGVFLFHACGRPPEGEGDSWGAVRELGEKELVS